MRALRRRQLFTTVAILDSVRLTANIAKFRARHLKAAASTSVGGALEHMFQSLASVSPSASSLLGSQSRATH